ncbi:MAG TPA: RNA polymerase sigma factor SigJ [Acidimicrobiales bacterium]|jgi:RNA polymerase sigma-70 factor (ECF subfamily)|nr:RNA polymerase sigma factor SigJ [Acidimicrobiales bacterium]
MPSPDLDADAAAFEEYRSLLFGIAYRMLGSGADAEDVVQDASLRWLRRSDRDVESVRAYLVTIVTRLCLDQLDSALARRVTYAGPWLPEPVVVDEEDAVEQADSLSLAFLVLLEELTPLERAAYLLHDIFGYSFEEVARSLGRTPAACRQLGARARKRIEERRQRFDADLRQGRALTDRFLVACATGDLSGLLSMLSDDVVVWTDGGGKVRAAMRPVVGPYRSSRFLLNVAKKLHGVPRATVLNGQPATVFVDRGSVVAALVLDIMDGTIVGVRSVTNPDKLTLLNARMSESAPGNLA